MDWEPALIVEADHVMKEILVLAENPAFQQEE